MKKVILLSAFAVGCCGQTHAETPYAISHYVVGRRAVDMSGHYDSVTAHVRNVIPAYVSLVSKRKSYASLLEYVGKKLPDNQAALACAEEVIGNMESNGHPKVSKARKDLLKGKLNKECGPVLSEMYEDVRNAAFEAEKTMKSTSSMISGLEWSGVNEPVEALLRLSGAKSHIVYDTIPNPLFNKHVLLGCEDLEEQEKMDQIGDWGWAVDDELVFHEQSYPKQMKYHYFKNHPDYAARNDDDPNWRKYVFDREGNLKRVLWFTTRQASNMYKAGWFDTDTYLFRIAWRDNAYNIQSAPQSVRHAILVRAGLEGKTAAEKAQDARRDKAFDKALKESLNARMKYGDSWIARQKDRKAALTAFSTPSGVKYSEQADNWMRQIRLDYKHALDRPRKVERIDDVTFRVTYMDDDYKASFRATVKYEFSAPIGSSESFDVDSRLMSLERVENGESVLSLYAPNFKLVDVLPDFLAADYKPADDYGRYYIAPDVDKSADYKGGDDGLVQFIAHEFKSEFGFRSSKSVDIDFLIDTDGTVAWVDVESRDSNDKEFEAEILRVVCMMDKWSPATFQGHAVRSRVARRLRINGGRLTVRPINEKRRSK